jgi:hypothetical protein
MTPLKGNRTNFVLFVLTVISGLATLAIAHQVYGFTIERKGLIFFALLIPPLFLGSLTGYLFGGYRSV